MAKVLDDGLMLTLGVVGVVAAAGAVAGRRGSRAMSHGNSMGNAILWVPSGGGALDGAVYISGGDGRRSHFDQMTLHVSPIGGHFMWELREGGKVVSSGREDTRELAKKSAGEAVDQFAGTHGSRAMAHAYVVVNKMSHGSKRLHGPFSSMEEAEKWASAHGKTAVVKTVNLVSKTGGDFMVIEDHSDGVEVCHGFFNTAESASRWINRQPDEQTLIDSFVVRVHRP